MTGAIIPCAFCDSLRKDAEGLNICTSCVVSSGFCTACQNYVALEAKISETKRLLDDLLSQRLEVRSRVNQTHDLLTTRVPVEITRAVFQFCIPEKWSFSDSLNDPNPDEVESGDWGQDLEFIDKRKASDPLLLGRICRTWRHIAWDMQSLWTVLRLDFSRLGNPNNLTLTREWLDRAGLLPLSLHITDTRTVTSGGRNHEDKIATQLVEFINQRSYQWENLDISGRPWWIVEVKPVVGVSPNFRALRIGFNRSQRSGVFGDEFSLTKSKLRPSQLSLYNCTSNLIHIDWNHLTQVFLSNMTLEDTFEVFRRAPNLVYCKFYLISARDHSSLDMPIVYQALETLEFDCTDDGEYQPLQISSFVKSFLFSNLKHLKIKTGGMLGHTQQYSWHPVLNYILNTCPSLISFGMQHPGPDSIINCIFHIFGEALSLRDLTISTSSEEFFLVKLLGETSRPSDDSMHKAFVPNLQFITFTLGPKQFHGAGMFWNTIPEIFGPIAEISHPRRRPLKRLRVRAEVGTAVGLSERQRLVIESREVVVQLLKLRREGMILDLKSADEKVDILEKSIKRHGLQSLSG